MSDLVCCRYNKNHKVKRSRLVIHEYKCPDKDRNPDIIVSPFDPNEKINIKNYEKHCKKYEPKIDEDLKKSIKEYIDNNNEDNYKNLQEIRVKELKGNYKEEKKNIVGMDNKKKKKPKKSYYENLNDDIKLKSRDDYIENEDEFLKGIKSEGKTFDDNTYTQSLSNDLFSITDDIETFEDTNFDPNKYDLNLDYLNKQNMIDINDYD